MPQAPATTDSPPADATSEAEASARNAVVLREVRVLDGPNLYFSRPAIKVTLDVPGYVDMARGRLTDLGEASGMSGVRPGRRGSALRQRFVMRLVRRIMRQIAREAGARRLGVRVRAGGPLSEVIVAYPWANRTRGETAGEALAAALTALAGGTTHDQAIEDAAELVRQSPDGPGPTVLTPHVPVASITGTNGKTTTTRLLAHMCMTARLKTAWSSTDGVVVMGETILDGDYSGPAGARGVLETPGLDIGILETARGGMLLRGMGVTANDVSVVTNVSADHLGLQGIETLDQLAEVKAIVTTITKPTGWVVLNGDDPRTWAMHYGIKARPWAFSLDPDAPALWESINAGGRGITVLDGQIVVLASDGDPDRLVRVVDVPMTLSGLSRNNIANALAGAAAALGLGLPREAVIEGLKTFAPDPELNSGRLNTYSVPLEGGDAKDSATVIVDMAHNEAGLEALLDVARGLAAPGAAVRLALGCAGDRADEAIVSMGEIAGRGSDEVVIKVTEKYLRGRAVDEINDLFHQGLESVGMSEVPVVPTELEAVHHLVGQAHPGDVVAVMCHAEREAIDAWLREHDGTVDSARTIRSKVVAARGEHEFEAEIQQLRAMPDATERAVRAEALSSEHPKDARLLFELAESRQLAGQTEAAAATYEGAIDRGLGEPYLHQARLGLASMARLLGDPERSLRLIDEVRALRPNSVVAVLQRALALRDLGRDREAVGELMVALAESTTDVEAGAHRRALLAYAAEPGPARH